MSKDKTSAKSEKGKEEKSQVYIPSIQGMNKGVALPSLPSISSLGMLPGKMSPSAGMPLAAGIPPGMMVPQQSQPQAIDFEKVKQKLEGLKKNIVKKYRFTIAFGILPAQAAPMFEEDEQIPKEIADTRPLYALVIIPEEQYKNVPKIKPEIIKMAKETGENLWVLIKTPIDLWNYGLDSKYEFLDAISAMFPLHDSGFLGALRVANIHKSLSLRKFDKYVASYVVGGSLVRGTAGKDSDVDVFIIIDDTDVKRMSRIDLLERLRNIIVHDFIREANALAGVKNILNVQVWLLTDFWQRVKDAEPVAFTFIRDGIPLYDRGTFIPWKLLLKMGRIKPSPEAIDLYMKQGEQTEEIVKRKMLDIMVDIYYGVVTPTQALMMLTGEAPPVPKTIVADVKKVFVDQMKVMTDGNLKTLEKAVHYFKQYEYGKLKEFSGKELDAFLKETKEYNAMLKELRKKIEKNLQQKTAQELYNEVFGLLKTFFGQHPAPELVKQFETQMIKKGKISGRFSLVMKELVNLKSKVSSGKMDALESDRVRKDALELINALVEYAQRADLVKTEKGLVQITYAGNRKAEVVLLGNINFIIEGKDIRKVSDGKLVTSTQEEFDKALSENKGKLTTKISGELFKVLEKELGKFELEL
ncbi:MAG: nucleotidyltransferase domain-containing protein [Nanoarchaeota archaeon]